MITATEYIPYGDPDSEQLMYEIDTFDDSAYEDQLEEEELEKADFFLFI